MTTETLDALLAYTRRGWAVFPTDTLTDEPSPPPTPDGATMTTEARIAWWRGYLFAIVEQERSATCVPQDWSN